MRVKLRLAVSAPVVAIGLAMLPLLSLAAGTKASTASMASNAQALDHVEQADKIIGREVQNDSKQKVGKVEDIAVDLESGRVLYVVISAGGFLGVGDRSIAMPLGTLTDNGRQLLAHVTKVQLQQAPEFPKSRNRRAQMFDGSFVSRVNQFFKQGARSSGEPLAAGGRFGNAHLVSDLKGMDVRSISNQKIGDVENVAIDLSAGRVVYVILSPDRSLNLGNRLFALPPDVLTLSADKKFLNTGIDREQLAIAPSFEKSIPPDMSNGVWGARVYRFYGKEPYFEAGSLQPTSRGTNSMQRLYHEPKKP